MGKSRTTEEILALTDTLERYYSTFHSQCETEDAYYNLTFDVPTVVGADALRAPTARLAIDDAAAQLDTTNIRIDVRPRNSTSKAQEQAERERKFLLGSWHRIYSEQGLVLHDVAKHLFLYGASWVKVLFDKDLWGKSPSQKRGEDIVKYAERIAEWREQRNLHFPLVLAIINPQNVFPDPSVSQTKYVIEKTERRAIDIIDRYPDWGGHISQDRLTDFVVWIEYWDDEYASYIADNVTVMPCKKHNYGFLPYVGGSSGLGYIARDVSPEKRWRGLLNPVHDYLVRESRLDSAIEVIMQRSAWPDEYFQGDNPAALKEIVDNWSNDPGVQNIISDTQIKRVREVQPVVPPEAFSLRQMTAQDLQRALVPRVATGERPIGAASGYMTAILASLARIKFGPALKALESICEQVNERFLKLVENVIQDDVTVWGVIPSGTFDQTINPRDINGYYQNTVKLSSISPEEEERTAMLGLRLNNARMISKRLAATKYVKVENPIEDEIQMMKEAILNSPEVLQAMTMAFMQTQQMQQEIAMRAGGALPGMGNQGVPPPVSPRPNEPQRGAVTRAGMLPGSPEEMDLVGRQVSGRTPATQQLWWR